MEFDVWFAKQHKAVQVLLIAVPLLGWVMEILIRLSIMLKTSHVIHVAAFLVILIFGWLHIPCVLDVISLIVTKKLIYEEVKK